MATFRADNLPSQSGDTEKDVKSLRNYVYELQESLRYTLTNLGEENFNETDLQRITQPIYASIKQTDAELGELAMSLQVTSQGLQLQITQNKENITTVTATANGLQTRVANAEGNISALAQTAEGLTTQVANAEGNISTLNQTANNIAWQVSDLSGQVSTVQQTVDGLSITTSGGTSYITGDHIKSGTIIGATLIAYDSGGVAIYNDDPDAGGSRIGGLYYDDESSGTERYKVYLYAKRSGSYYNCLKLESAGSASFTSEYGSLYLYADSYLTLKSYGAINIYPDNANTTWEFRDGGLYKNGTSVL